MRFHSPLLNAVLTCCLALTIADTVSAQSRYALTEIAPLPGDRSTGAWDINNLGQVLAASSPTTDLDIPEARPIIWKAGSVQKLPGLPGGGVGAQRMNNTKTVVGVHWPESGSVNTIYWRSIQPPLALPTLPDMDQYYPVGLSDLGLITGFATFYPHAYKGFLFDTNTARLDLNETFIFGDSNNNGDMIRAPGDRYDAPVEVSTGRGNFVLRSPPGLDSVQGVLDARISSAGTVTSFLGDNDGSDGCTGCGGSCVRWDPPSFDPRVFNPPVFGSKDYCSPGRANKRGDVLVLHSIEHGEDNYESTSKVVLNGSYYKLLALCPELARYSSFYANAINDNREIVGTGYRDSVARGFILRPLP